MRQGPRNLMRRAGRAQVLESADQLATATRDTLSLEALLLDYEMARDDERTVTNIQAGLYGVAIALIALMAGALTQECGFGMKQPPDCTNVPDAILAAVPILPLGLIAFIQSIGSVSTIRSYYLRGLEVEIGRFADKPMTALGDLRPVSYIGLTTEFVSLRRGGVANRLLFNVILAAILVVFGGMTIYIGMAIAPPYQAAMALVYGTVVGILVTQTVEAVFHGPRLFRSVAQRFVRGPGYAGLPRAHADAAADGVEQPRVPRARSLTSYLVLPRPEDLIKWTIAPLTYAAFAWTVGDWADWRRFVLAWIILEYLTYMARYQWNDVRGVVDDWGHREARARGRLPATTDRAESRRNIMVSLLVAGLRLILAMLIAGIAGLTGQVAAMIAAVFGVAVLYEFLRSRTRGGLTVSTVAIWLLVGAGYAIRGAVGIGGAGVSLLSRPALAGMGFLLTFGMMFVLLTWVLDASSYGRVEADGSWSFRSALRRKPHLAELLRFVPVKISRYEEPPDPDDTEQDDGYGGARRLLRDNRRRPRPLAPWNLAHLAAAVSAAVLGIELAGSTGRGPGVHAAAVASCLLFAVLLQQLRNGWVNGLTIAAGAVPLVALSLSTGLVPALLGAAPWLVASLTYLSFRNSSYQDLKSFGPTMVKHLRRIPAQLLRVIVGTVTWEGVVDTPHRRDDAGKV
ncbi:hypothetical protein AB0F72_13605 [Actinoplanes sp. NPDC023936]|uniref:hypothetical protein n=1 Tax=Actinoplanes sp. NPDC023936 TaxID=3154910 RepID=UPI0033C40614